MSDKERTDDCLQAGWKAKARAGWFFPIARVLVMVLVGIGAAWPPRTASPDGRMVAHGLETSAPDPFAQNALDSLLGDLRQEIAAGSRVVTPATGVTVYAPKAPATAVPALVGFTPKLDATTKLENDGLNNLVKRSARGQAFFSGTNYDTATYPAPARAAAVGSDVAALNGRYISAERWNKPLLLAKKDPSSESSAPTSDFVPPDWVLVARDGSNPTAWNANLIDTGTNPTAVVGRYTYAIYDEGGLLDASVAGYASSVPAAQAAYKSSLNFADLTQLTDATGGQLLTQAQIDALIDWRNAHPLFSRQDLLDFLTRQLAVSGSRATLQNAMQYLGTFSRGLEQPSFIRTQSVDATDLFGYDSTAPKLLDPTKGGNNAGPSGGSSGLDAAINPSFPAVRVNTTTAQGRFDGSDLVVGEPLVKKRFALSRLAWLTFAGPICADGTNYNSATGVDVIVKALKEKYGFTDPFLKQGTAANIQNYFGLVWDATNNRWNYVHNQGGSNGKAICKLNYASDGMDVLRANREADFFELLKATVNVGSLGKVGTVSLTDANAGKLLPSQLNQYQDDYRVDDAIIQMGTNIIDQFDLDGYSTQIYFNDGSTSAGGKVFHGVENLPYLSRITDALIKVKQADPTLISSGTSATITNTGVGAVMQFPEIWNPHDYNMANADQIKQTAGVVGPTQFRVYAVSGTSGVNNVIQLLGIIRDPNNDGANIGHRHTSAVATKSPGYQSQYGFSFTSSEARTLNLANTELDFTVARDAAGLTRFREPTTLFLPAASGGYVDGSPATSGFGVISANAGFFANGGFRSDVSSGITGVPPVQNQGYVGFYLGAVPLYWSDSLSSGNPFYWLDNIAPINSTDVHYYLQYKDVSGTWVTYDEKYRTLGGSGIYSENSTICGGGNRSASTNGWESFMYPRVTGRNNNWDVSYAAMDPRSARFGLMKLVAGKSDAPWWTFPPYSPTGTNATRSASASAVGFAQGWIDASKGIGLSLRSGTNDGTPMYTAVGVFPTTMGWNPGSPVSAPTGGRFPSYDNITLGATTGSHVFHPGLMSQNNPFVRRNNRAMGDSGDPVATDSAFTPPSVSNAAQFYTDADGVIRRASGGLVPYTAGSGPAAITNAGLPGTPANKLGTQRFSQSDSRPVVLNRPFRTVAELGYTFSGTPWKNLNFNMPESPDVALLDVFCVNASDDASGLVAGKVNLNTRQPAVLQAILAGAYKDEWNPADPANGTLAGGTNGVAAKIAATLVKRTASGPATGLNANKPLPLGNVSELVGKWVSYVPGDSANGVSGNASTTDAGLPIINPRSYDGFSADLIDNRYTAAGDGVLVNSADTNATIPRFTDASVRALSGTGQTRVWNLLIDVVAQTGQYPASASSFAAFAVTGEQRYWLHVAIDRYTGEVLAQSLENVPEPAVALTNAGVLENQPVGTPVGTINVAGTNPTGTYTLALVSGEGSTDNASFTLSGNQLRTAAVFQYLTQSTYHLRVRVTDQTGASFDEDLAVAVLPGPFTQWKIAYFGEQANNPAVAGDLADPDQDGLTNMMEYALGKSPTTADGSAITVQKVAGALRVNYTRLSTATDVTVHAYWTSDLKDPASWTANGVTETLLSDDGTLQQWQADVPTNFGQSIFVRLQATKP